jgi:uncharacterized protein (DUF2267 family)
MSLNFNQYATEGNTFIKAYTEHLGLGNDYDKAGRMLSAILHSLRDIIPFAESLQFMAQLPMFLKAVYVNGWSGRRRPQKIRRMEEFIELLRTHQRGAAANDFGDEDEEVEKYLQLTFMFLRKYVSLGELEDIRDSLPKDMKFMVYSNLMF